MELSLNITIFSSMLFTFLIQV